MKELQNRIQQMLREKKTHSRAVALITALSLLMMIIVPDLSAIPGVALTVNPLIESTLLMSANEGDIPEVYTTAPSNAVNLDGHITSLSITTGGTKYEEQNGVVTIEAGDKESLGVSAAMKFNFQSGSELNQILANRLLYFQIPANTISLTNMISGSDCVSTDPEYNAFRNNNLPSGYYSISQEGLIVLKLTEDYIDYLTAKQTLNGNAAFNGVIKRSEDEEGEQNLTISEGHVVTVKFRDAVLSMSKEGSVGMENGERYIDWKLTITNPKKRVNMAGWTLSDLLNESTVIDVSGATVSPSGCTENDGNNLRFISTPDSETITVTYRQTGVQSGSENANVAKLSKPDKSDVTASKTVSIVNQITAEKDGYPDYQCGEVRDGKIHWTVSLHNLSGDSLKNTFIEDTKINSSAGVEVYYYDSQNQKRTVAPEMYEIIDGKLTFKDNASIPSDLIVGYTSSISLPQGQGGSEIDTNSATIGTNETVNKPEIPPNPVTKTVTYRNETNISKSYDDFIRDAETVKWRIGVYSNAINKQDDNWTWNLDDLNTATVNGYTVTDTAFAGLEASDISVNAFHAVGTDSRENRGSNIEGAVTITKESKDSDTITITVNNDQPINYVVLFYEKSLEDSQFVGDGSVAKYRNGDPVTVTNTATVTGNGQSGTGTGSQSLQTRNQANKTYDGLVNEGQLTTVDGTADKEARLMKWTVHLIKDNGFSQGDITMTDLLQTKTAEDGVPANGGKHYITQSQAAALTLVGHVTEGANVADISIPTTAYTIKWYDENGAETFTENNSNNAVKFEITFTSSISSSIRYIDIQYQSTADVENIPKGNAVKFVNHCTFGSTDQDYPGIIFKRNDPSEKKMNLTLNKTWNDAGNAYDSRPEQIQVKIERAQAGANNAVPTAEEAWSQYPNENTVYTLKASSSSNTDAFTILSNVPQYYEDPTTGALTRYYYRITELAVEGYSTAYTQNNILSHDGSSDFAITNTSTQTYKKVAIDKEGSSITAIKISQVPTATVKVNNVDTECYIFAWDLALTLEKYVGEHTFVDTLPENAVFIGPDMGPSEYYAVFSWGTWEEILDGNNDYAGTVTQAGRQLTIAVNNAQDPKHFIYYTAIPVDKLDETLQDGKLINSVVKNGESSPSNAELTVIKDSTPSTEKLLGKQYTESINGGELKYELDVNPDGRILSNDGKIVITDLLTLDAANSSRTADGLGFSVDVKVYPYEGTTASATELPANQYSYRVEYDSTETIPIEVTKSDITVSNNGTDYDVWLITGWKPGDLIDLTAIKEHDYYYEMIRCWSVEANCIDGLYGNSVVGDLISFPTPADGVINQSFTVPNGCKTVAFLNEKSSGCNPITSISAQIRKVTLAKLIITLPDQQHYKVTYTYTVTGYNSTKQVVDDQGNTIKVNGDTLVFSNEASFKTDNAEATAKSTKDTLNVQESSFQTGTEMYPKIYKVDVNSEGLNTLGTTLKVAKWKNGNWIYSKRTSTVSVKNDGGAEVTAYRQFNFDELETPLIETNDKYPKDAGDVIISQSDDQATEDRENLHDFALEENALYKVVEIVAPANTVDTKYLQPDWNIGNDGTPGKTLTQNAEFVYYFTYNGYSATKYGTMPTQPENLSDLIHNIKPNGKMNIANSQIISISAKKTFTGGDVTESKVKLELLVSETGSISDAVPVSEANILIDTTEYQGDIVELDYPGDTTAEWKGIPSGKNGKVLYYFVREKSYTYNNVEYTLQSDGVTYKDASGNPAPFKPIYTGNGTNVDGTEIEVVNAKGIIVEKQWKDLNGNTVEPPKEPTDTSKTMKVEFSLIGIKEDGTEVELVPPEPYLQRELNNYQYAIPDPISDTEGNSHALSEFKNYSFEEVLTDAQVQALYNRYKSSPDYLRSGSIADGVGKLMIVNTNITSDTTKASVEKKWSDSATNTHSNDQVSVTLVQSTSSSLTEAQIASLAENPTFTGSPTVMLLKPNETAEYVLASGVGYIGHTLEGTSVATVTKESDKLTITGKQAGTATLTIRYDDGSSTELMITVINPSATLQNGSWTAEWTNLPFADADDNRYYYYVYESNSSDFSEYTPVYQHSITAQGHKTTITNTLPTSLSIAKTWIDEDGVPIITDKSAASYDVERAALLPDSVNVELYRVPKTEGTQTQGDASVKSNSYKIMALGDSITFGYIGWDDATSKGGYRTHFSSNLTANGFTNFEMVGAYDNYGKHMGMNSQTISQIEQKLVSQITKDQSDSPNIIILMAGTNDVLNTYDDIDTVQARFKSLADAIYQKSPDDVKLYVVSPPRIYSTGWLSNQQSQTSLDNRMAKLLAATENVVNIESQTHYCKYLDFYTYLNTYATNNGKEYYDYLADYTHPNETGYQLLGEYLATQISNDLLGIQTTGYVDNPENVSAFTTEQFSHIFTAANKVTTDSFGNSLDLTLTKDDGYQLTLKNLDEKAPNGQPYLYYIMEEAASKNVLDGSAYKLTGNEFKYITQITYADNGQQVNAANPLQITNQIASAKLNLQKAWSGVDDTSGYTVKVKVHRTTTPDAEDSERNTQNLMLQIPTSASIGVGETKTITANKNIQLVSVKQDDAYAEVSVTDDTVTVKGKAKGSVEITVTDGTETKTITVEITENLTVSKGTDALTSGGTITLIAGGDNVLLNTNKPNVTVSPTIPSGLTITPGTSGGKANFTIVPTTAGSTELTFTNSDKEGDTFTLTVVVVAPLQITASPASVVEGGTVTLTPTPSDVDVDYTVKSGAGVLDGNTLTATGNGSGSIIVSGTYDVDGAANTGEVTVQMEAFAINGSEDVTIGSSTQLGTNVPNGYTVSWASSDTTNFPIDASGSVSAASTLQGGETATITATFEDAKGNTHTATKIVTAKGSSDIMKISPNPLIIKVGQTITLTSVNGFNIAQYNNWVNNIDSTQYIQYGTNNGATLDITGKAVGFCYLDPTTQDSMASVKTDHVEVYVVPNVIELAEGETVTLPYGPEYTTTGDSVSISGNTVTALVSGTAIVTATLGSTSVSIPVSVTKYKWVIVSENLASADFSGYVGKVKKIRIDAGNSYGGGYFWLKDINNNIIKDSWGNAIQFSTNNCQREGNYTIFDISAYPTAAELTDLQSWNGYDNIQSIAVYVPDDTADTNKFTAKHGFGLTLSSAKRAITAAQNVPSNAIFKAQSRGTSIDTPTFENDGFMYITLNEAGNWQKELSDLKVYDNNGNQYYYWAEEVEVKSNGTVVTNDFTASYSYTDGRGEPKIYSISSESPGSGVIKIRNTKIESDSSTLPETGGSGTKIYYTIGGMLLMLGAAGYVTIKRRRWFDG